MARCGSHITDLDRKESEIAKRHYPVWKKDALYCAIELYYSDEVVAKICESKNEEECQRILYDARTNYEDTL